MSCEIDGVAYFKGSIDRHLAATQPGRRAVRATRGMPPVRRCFQLVGTGKRIETSAGAIAWRLI